MKYSSLSIHLKKVLQNKNILKSSYKDYDIIKNIIENIDILNTTLNRFTFTDYHLALIYIYEILFNKKYNLYKKALKQKIIEIKDVKYFRINTSKVIIDVCYQCKHKNDDKNIENNNDNKIDIENNDNNKDTKKDIENNDNKNYKLSHILLSLKYYYTPFPFIFVLNQPIDSLVQKYIKEDLIFIQDISSTLPAMLFSFDNNIFLKDKENKCKCMNNNHKNDNDNDNEDINKKDTNNDNDNKLPSIVDCCAAPGNKSTQLLMLYNCNLVSIEKDRLRYNTLIKFISKIKRNITKESISNVINTLNIDFFDYNIPTEYIMLDPSCSGSGIHKIYIKDKERIEKLHILQTNILLHALSLNPKRLVYSTCSIHREENEDVIKYILENNNNYKLISVKEELENIIERYTHNKILLDGIIEYKDRNINDSISFNIENKIDEFINDDMLCFNKIISYGIKEYEFYKKVLRVNNDISNGFFIAILERKE